METVEKMMTGGESIRIIVYLIQGTHFCDEVHDQGEK
jgi:hypothetical protein